MTLCVPPLLPNPQRGDTAAALPLYERALAIWEAAGGPHSPDVAHTLTDIAVIHLEAVRAALWHAALWHGACAALSDNHSRKS